MKLRVNEGEMNVLGTSSFRNLREIVHLAVSVLKTVSFIRNESVCVAVLCVHSSVGAPTERDNYRATRVYVGSSIGGAYYDRGLIIVSRRCTSA